MIKKLLFYMITGMLLLHACKERGRDDARFQTFDSTRLTRVELPETMFDFGDVAPGEIVGHAFSVKNAGEKDLFIQDVLASCGCTTSNYTRKPVKPGKSGTIEVKFNSAGQHGKQYKVIHVYSNVREKKFELVVKANIQN
ncbi:MAG: DUF1573 domain-containing protein [Odoribacteraceae bacterium]|jgi:hypothetical protein|nr:DUF1573 domain-containing protein [Odoribacteraceae bacterium]